MDRSFWSWLIGESGAGWIVGAAGLIWGIVSALRKRSSRVIVEDQFIISLTKISNMVKNDIQISYKDSNVKNLFFFVTRITNDGDSVIQGVDLQFFFSKETKILDVVRREARPGTVIGVDSEAGSFSLHLDYLNPFNEHKDVFEVAVLMDGDSTLSNVTGIGKGWSLRHVKIPTPDELKKRWRWLFLSLIGVTVCGIAADVLMQRFLNARGAMVYAPGILMSLVWLSWALKQNKWLVSRKR